MKKYFLILLMSLLFVACEKKEKSESLQMTSYGVEINYDLTLADAVLVGDYSFVHPYITDANFPKTREGKIKADIFLLSFERDISSEEIIQEMEKNHLRPAELSELLALGTQYPELQLDFPIIALGSKWQSSYGWSDVPVLSEFSLRRRLDLVLDENHWTNDLYLYYFAAIKK